MNDYENTQDVGRDESASDHEGVAGRLTRFTQVTGAAVSLALVVGIGYWGTKLVMRDVSGIPVVRAVEGPMRIQPDNPGGQLADHQGLAVNMVAAAGSAEPPPDRLLLAPAPVDLTEEDVASALLSEAASPEEIETASDPDAVTRAMRQGAVDELVAELTRGAAPLDPVPAAAPAGPLRVSAPAPAVAGTVREAQPMLASFTGPGVARSPRPPARPALARASVVRASLPQAPAPVADIDPDSLPEGTRLAQLGAFDSAEVARREWDRIAERYADYMEGKSRVIQQASSGGRIFFRLRAHGFQDISDARRFCSALVAEGADCIPVTAR